MKNKKSFFIKMLLSNFFLFFVLSLTVILGWKIYGEYNNNKSIDYQVEELKQEIKDIEDNNRVLNQTIEYFDSDIFIEKEAREKFGLKKNGEQVLVVPKEIGITDKSQDHSIDNKNKKTKESLPKLWREYFFVDK